jgi:hypothetical protein
MKDQWDEMLRCPNCRKSGIASLRYEKSEEMQTVHSVPDGFKVVDTQFGPSFHCETCNVEVTP